MAICQCHLMIVDHSMTCPDHIIISKSLGQVAQIAVGEKGGDRGRGRGSIQQNIQPKPSLFVLKVIT